MLYIKEGEKRDKYLNQELNRKKLWNMKVTVILILIGNVTKGFGSGAGGLTN